MTRRRKVLDQQVGYSIERQVGEVRPVTDSSLTMVTADLEEVKEGQDSEFKFPPMNPELKLQSPLQSNRSTSQENQQQKRGGLPSSKFRKTLTNPREADETTSTPPKSGPH